MPSFTYKSFVQTNVQSSEMIATLVSISTSYVRASCEYPVVIPVSETRLYT